MKVAVGQSTVIVNSVRKKTEEQRINELAPKTIWISNPERDYDPRRGRDVFDLERDQADDVSYTRSDLVPKVAKARNILQRLIESEPKRKVTISRDECVAALAARKEKKK